MYSALLIGLVIVIGVYRFVVWSKKRIQEFKELNETSLQSRSTHKYPGVLPVPVDEPNEFVGPEIPERVKWVRNQMRINDSFMELHLRLHRMDAAKKKEFNRFANKFKREFNTGINGRLLPHANRVEKVVLPKHTKRTIVNRSKLAINSLNVDVIDIVRDEYQRLVRGRTSIPLSLGEKK